MPARNSLSHDNIKPTKNIKSNTGFKIKGKLREITSCGPVLPVSSASTRIKYKTA